MLTRYAELIKKKGIKRCPICQSNSFYNVFTHSSMPIYNLKRHYNQESASKAETGKVEFVICKICGFVFNRLFSYNNIYENVDYESSRSGSQKFLSYLMETASYVQKQFNFDTVVEIGSGDGQFLRILHNKKRFKKGIGYDINLNDAGATSKNILFKKEYYTKDSNINPDLIILRHIIEHIPLPKDFFISILHESNELGIFIEIPCWEWIVKHNQFFAFSYEHCSYYSKENLIFLMNSLQFKVKNIRYSFDDEYIQACFEKEKYVAPSYKPSGYILRETNTFVENMQKNFDVIYSLIKKYSGDIVLWGAGGKGTNFLNILNIYHDKIPYAVDINPRRHNTFIPRTAQQVISPDKLIKIRPHAIFITNSIYKNEIQAELNRLNINTELIPIDKMVEIIE